MTCVALRGIHKTFSGVSVLNDVNLTIESGMFCVFVGPSGCGKSTLLRIIAGLDAATSGDVLFDGCTMNEAEPAQRKVAMVFQSYALYPHMSVRENLGFSLKLSRAPRPERDAAVEKAAKMLGVEDLLERKPRELSGGQRQRVAIGRAIVRRPNVFLFDEPLSNLDAELRTRMRYELAQLHQTLQATMIYVTHDQVEAMTLADRIVVLSNGRVQQTGKPLDLYANPANLFVATFLGSPRMNCLAGSIVDLRDGAASIGLADGTTVTAHVVAPVGARIGDQVTLGVRPEALRIDGSQNCIVARVSHIERLGRNTLVYLTGGPQSADPIVIRLDAGYPIDLGDRMRVYVDPNELHVFRDDGVAFERVSR